MSALGDLTGPLDLTDRDVLACWLSRVRRHVTALPPGEVERVRQPRPLLLGAVRLSRSRALDSRQGGDAS